MKIKAYEIKPGMLIELCTEDICLVTAVSKGTGKETELTNIGLVDPYWGRTIRSVNKNEEIRVIQGEKKKIVIKEILDGLWKRYNDAKEEIDLVKLIKSMDSM